MNALPWNQGFVPPTTPRMVSFLGAGCALHISNYHDHFLSIICIPHVSWNTTPCVSRLIPSLFFQLCMLQLFHTVFLIFTMCILWHSLHFGLHIWINFASENSTYASWFVTFLPRQPFDMLVRHRTSRPDLLVGQFLTRLSCKHFRLYSCVF